MALLKLNEVIHCRGGCQQSVGHDNRLSGYWSASFPSHSSDFPMGPCTRVRMGVYTHAPQCRLPFTKTDLLKADLPAVETDNMPLMLTLCGWSITLNTFHHGRGSYLLLLEKINIMNMVVL